MAVFPNIKPSGVSMTLTHPIKSGEISTEEDLNVLLNTMFNYQERRFELYQFINESNPIIDAAVNNNLIVVRKTEFRYFRYKPFEQAPYVIRILECDEDKALKHGDIVSNEMLWAELELTEYCKICLKDGLRKMLDNENESRKSVWTKIVEDFRKFNIYGVEPLKTLEYLWRWFKSA